MNKRIFKKRLSQFLEVHKKNNFAEITSLCGAVRFIKSNFTFNHSTGEMLTTYRFHTSMLEDDSNDLSKTPYVVLYIPNHSYLMYEIKDKKILLWVCYTEKESRNNGYMTLLLQKLISIYPKKTIIVDTYSNELLHVCKKLGIQSEGRS